jgi:hypothetical protein
LDQKITARFDGADRRFDKSELKLDEIEGKLDGLIDLVDRWDRKPPQ